ncbi:trehalose-phosphatase [Roseomonas sp. CCTCC AB2023176]|uniref:trehalose-phosphatase n=1 Tax=Roseomonas sp. CCTCC AB2023176 TaxID=3342640 RepID=UPI0035DDB87B
MTAPGPNNVSPPLPGDDAALFLDLDGTLLEIAPRPDEVVVPPGLPAMLAALHARLDGAVAIVTGRPLAVARGYAGVPAIAVAAEHGAVLDPPLPGTPPLPVPDPDWRRAADAWSAERPGTLVEHKTHGIVLHFRLAPEEEGAAVSFMEALLGGAAADHGFRLVPAHAAMELRPLVADKGGAVHRFMAVPPFHGRKPIFIGDDVTDEDGIAAAAAYGGGGLRVPVDFDGRPALVRDWLGRFVRHRITA